MVNVFKLIIYQEKIRRIGVYVKKTKQIFFIKYDTIYQEHFLYNNKKSKKRKLIIFSQFSETTFHHSCAHKISCASNL